MNVTCMVVLLGGHHVADHAVWAQHSVAHGHAMPCHLCLLRQLATTCTT